MTVSGASGAEIFTRKGRMDVSDSPLAQSSIGLEADTNPYLNVTNSVISFNATIEVFYRSLPGGIFASRNCTFFGNNNVAGPPGGPSSQVSAQAVVRTGHTPPPPEEVRQRQP